MKNLLKTFCICLLVAISASTAFNLTSAEPGKAVVAASDLPLKIAPADVNIKYVGRFDTSDAAGPKCAWSASNITIKFNGTAANVKMSGRKDADRWQVSVDGKPTQVITMTGSPALFSLAADLPAGEHTVSMMRCGEAHLGPSQILGFQLSQDAKLLPVPAAKHRLEVIGDSISCGYGNEANAKEEHFTPQTENAYKTYGAIAARALDADYMCIAWSGKCMWPKNTIPEIYGRTLPFDASSKFDFSKWKPEAIVINLCTNDFGKETPEEEGWVKAYKEFISGLRKNNADAVIFCSVGPMMSDAWPKDKKALSTASRYLNRIVDECTKEGDKNIFFLKFDTQTGSNGYGADWHPSAKQHEVMSGTLINALKEKLKW
ncbi:MAG TPA: GDSL family lipase [Lentisphaeria bacterium]|nr:MAG: hypothetical protein A2X45_15170 [Lentisphaerae bacterium GWF2_50_93]HCE42425.1 GDSL family lipase [Lentisphaeria bacterium]